MESSKQKYGTIFHDYDINDMKCTACKENIQIWEFDMLDAIEETNPITFRKGAFHMYCYGLLIEEAEQTISNNNDYTTRLDEYISRDLAIISV